MQRRRHFREPGSRKVGRRLAEALYRVSADLRDHSVMFALLRVLCSHDAVIAECRDLSDMFCRSKWRWGGGFNIIPRWRGDDHAIAASRRIHGRNFFTTSSGSAVGFRLTWSTSTVTAAAEAAQTPL